MVPTAQDFERSLSSIANTKPTVTFFAEDVTVANTAFLKQLARVSFYKPIRIASAAKINTQGGAAIVSMTMSCASPTATTNSCAISLNAELLRKLRAI